MPDSVEKFYGIRREKSSRTKGLIHVSTLRAATRMGAFTISWNWCAGEAASFGAMREQMLFGTEEDCSSVTVTIVPALPTVLSRR